MKQIISYIKIFRIECKIFPQPRKRLSFACVEEKVKGDTFLLVKKQTSSVTKKISLAVIN